MLISKIIKNDFPIFNEQPELVYLDSTATTLKPKEVIDKVSEYYSSYSANVFRGIYQLSEKATEEYEHVRKLVAKHINAKSSNEIVFVKGTTEALNLLANSLGRQVVNPGSEIVTSVAEHHSNFVPWQQLALKNKALLKVVEVDENGNMPIFGKERIEELISEKTKIVSLNYVSNVLGTINPIKKIIKNIRMINKEVYVIVDAAQAVPSLVIDVQNLDCDLLVFSAHKMLGPTGVGVLWGKKHILQEMPPFQFGGEMIERVTLSQTTYKDVPYKFEAGTPNIAGVIGFGAALKYLDKIGKTSILKHEQRLLKVLIRRVMTETDFRIVGPQDTKSKVGILSFYHDKIHPHDVSQLLASDNICVRAGTHCAMPLHQHLNVSSTVRASIYLYNTLSDINKLISALIKTHKLFI
jgi:cysteine desulfurase/selenocysteine lyase